MLTYMPDETETLLRRLISGDQAAVAAVLAGARTSDTPALLVAAALISGDSDGLLLVRATTHADGSFHTEWAGDLRERPA